MRLCKHVSKLLCFLLRKVLLHYSWNWNWNWKVNFIRASLSAYKTSQHLPWDWRSAATARARTSRRAALSVRGGAAQRGLAMRRSPSFFILPSCFFCQVAMLLIAYPQTPSVVARCNERRSIGVVLVVIERADAARRIALACNGRDGTDVSRVEHGGGLWFTHCGVLRAFCTQRNEWRTLRKKNHTQHKHKHSTAQRRAQPSAT